MKRTYNSDEARSVAERLRLDFATSGFDLEQFQAGLNVEAEHGAVDPETNVTDDDPLTTGKIALAHLNEMPDYYTRLGKMEADAGMSATPARMLPAPAASRKRRLVGVLSIGLAIVIVGVMCAQFYRKRRATKWLH